MLMVAAESQLEGFVHVDSRSEAMMRRWWPGPLTLILHAKGGGTLGVRIPKHKVALDLLRAAGPLMTTSANLHGNDPAMTARPSEPPPACKRRARCQPPRTPRVTPAAATTEGPARSPTRSKRSPWSALSSSLEPTT